MYVGMFIGILIRYIIFIYIYQLLMKSGTVINNSNLDYHIEKYARSIV